MPPRVNALCRDHASLPEIMVIGGDKLLATSEPKRGEGAMDFTIED